MVRTLFEARSDVFGSFFWEKSEEIKQTISCKKRGHTTSTEGGGRYATSSNSGMKRVMQVI